MNQQRLQQCLKHLDDFESAHSDNRSESARALVQALISAFGTAQVAAVNLDISPATLYRFKEGNISKRQVNRLRSVLTRVVAGTSARATANTEPSAYEPAIHDMEFFYSRAAFAKNIWIFKSFAEFQAGDSEQVLRRLRALFQSNTQLRMYVVCPAGSKAEETLGRFYELADALEEEWTKRIEQYSIPDSSEMLSLGLAYSTQVIIELSDVGRKRWNRLIELLIEVPLRVYENGEPNAFVKRLVLAELPNDQAHQLFAKWKNFLSRHSTTRSRGRRSVA